VKISLPYSLFPILSMVVLVHPVNFDMLEMELSLSSPTFLRACLLIKGIGKETGFLRKIVGFVNIYL
jgi:hypothetical protein